MSDADRSRRPTKGGPTTAEAEGLAIDALGFIAADATLLPRFLALTGLDASDLRRAAAEPGFLAGILAFLLSHEPTLLAFCSAEGADPARVAAAHARLAQTGHAL
ncbi:DUF3572 domain-containing protein [Aurantimonas sp. Leaf443]|uniref:DUF3572 domain-containing protein n=1 Tax=Aurantimonas sp. Leaf443 TaxID=1736378 RepID=UPI0006FC8400|nr:DUF3572 domain-containing protein [Aurantimonas sp. Leaf443]KQT86305.1 hypothetical protein ASG48_07050 [Aurantimonas sp. Leaf443]